LAEKQGRLVSKDRFVQEVWRGRAVTDGSLGKCIEEVRQALGPEAASYLRTVRGRGYVLEPANPETPDAPEDARADSGPLSRDAPTEKWAIVRLKAVVILVLAAVVMAAAAFYFARSGVFRQPIKAMAVLPFANGSGDPELEYLCDGITEHVIDRLSRLSGLRVTALSAVVHYKGREVDARTIGRELGVEAVLIGRVAKRGDTVGLALELVDARDNSHIWGDQYERELSELPAMAQEIPAAVSQRVRPRLSVNTIQPGEGTHIGNADAYQLYLKGRYSWEKWTADGVKQAIAYFAAAIDKDPDYALAYAGLADTYVFGAYAGGGLPPKEAHRRARGAASKALSLDPQLAEAHAALAEVLLYDEWDFAGAERELRRAIDLNPSYAEGHHYYSHLLLSLGRNKESLRESRMFLELDPVSESPVGHLGYHFTCAREFDAAIAQSLKDLQLYPDAPQDLLEEAYYGKSMFREAVDQYIRRRERSLTSTEMGELRAAFAASGINGFLKQRLGQLMSASEGDRNEVAIAAIYARLGQADKAFQHLDLAYAKHADGLVRIKQDLGFDTLRSDQRFANLLRRIGLPL